MRILFTAAAAFALTAVMAQAQYKPPATPPSQNSGAVQVTPNNNLQIQMVNPTADEDLSKARRIPRSEAMKMVKQGKAVWIDVRSLDSYDQGHIPGAISIPLSELMERMKELPPHKFLITYCA